MGYKFCLWGFANIGKISVISITEIMTLWLFFVSLMHNLNGRIVLRVVCYVLRRAQRLQGLIMRCEKAVRWLRRSVVLYSVLTGCVLMSGCSHNHENINVAMSPAKKAEVNQIHVYKEKNFIVQPQKEQQQTATDVYNYSAPVARKPEADQMRIYQENKFTVQPLDRQQQTTKGMYNHPDPVARVPIPLPKKNPDNIPQETQE